VDNSGRQTTPAISLYCKWHYPEAWELESLGLKVIVLRLRDLGKIKRHDRFSDTSECYHKKNMITKPGPKNLNCPADFSDYF